MYVRTYVAYYIIYYLLINFVCVHVRMCVLYVGDVDLDGFPDLLTLGTDNSNKYMQMNLPFNVVQNSCIQYAPKKKMSELARRVVVHINSFRTPMHVD